MGIVYTLKVTRRLKKYSTKAIKTSFYSSLLFFCEHKNFTTTLSGHILGKRSNFNIINPEHHMETLRRVKKVSYALVKKGSLLFVNSRVTSKFDGIIKGLSYRCGQKWVINRWPSGLLTKTNSLKISGLVIFNLKKADFAIKEANIRGLPIIGLSGLDVNLDKIMYPLLCNNLQGDSLFFNSFILSNSILEGKLFAFIKNRGVSAA